MDRPTVPKEAGARCPNAWVEENLCELSAWHLVAWGQRYVHRHGSLLTCPHVFFLQRLCSIAEPLHLSTVCVWDVPLLRELTWALKDTDLGGHGFYLGEAMVPRDVSK